MPVISFDSGQKTVQEIIHLYEKKLLNLNPGFQRFSVWSKTDRSNLIDSMIKNYPLPSVFFYRREHNGEIIYDVIDGKQRIESILMFSGVMPGEEFEAKIQLPDESKIESIDWKELKRRKCQSLINGYKLQVIEVYGELSDIIDLFVRINSTGKALTTAEKQHARYYNSDFLKKASQLAEKHRDYFNLIGVITANQASRMKHVELVCELIVAAHKQDVSDKRAALDRVMDAGSITGIKLSNAVSQTDLGIKKLKSMFPDLKQTRFRNLSDFYTLAVLIQKFLHAKMILDDKKRNQLAWDLLMMLSLGLDQLAIQQKKGGAASSDNEIFRNYMSTVRDNTDKESQRRSRESILRKLIESIFEQKDSKRIFSPEQRRLIWNSSTDKKCNKCKKQLTWEDFTIDHIKPYSSGGKTELANAGLMCQSCNSSKGNRSANSIKKTNKPVKASIKSNSIPNSAKVTKNTRYKY